MKKKLLICVSVFVTLASAAAAYVILSSKPPVETQFIQNVRDDSKPSEVAVNIKNPSDSGIVPVTPGDYALVDNFTHTYQTFNNCGPATLSMILSWHGEKISQKELGDKMRPYQNQDGDNDDKTIFTDEFADWAKEYGYESIGRVNGDIELLKKFAANGIPVVVKTWLHPNEDIGHFRVVRGFDESKEVIIQDDSYEGPNRKIAYFDFLSMWQPFNYAYIIVYKPEQKSLVEAIIGSEVDESITWQNALDRAVKESQLTPDNVYPWFNMSVAYYHLSDYENSIATFEKVESKLPRRMLWYEIGPILAYQKLGMNDRVFQIITNILENGNRAYSELYQIRGEIYLTQGNRELARKEFEQAVFYNSNFEKAKEALNDL